MRVVKQTFFNRSPLLVGPELLGKLLTRRIGQLVLVGRIVEVEAYIAELDEASHGFNGKTRANQSLFKAAGHAYVHRIHTQHCLDIVTEAEGKASSLLIRALEPVQGIEVMKQHRQKTRLWDLTSGPGKLTQALQITKELDGIDITDPASSLQVVDDGFVSGEIITTTRIGLSKATELAWRFYLKDNPFVSKP